MQLTSFGAAETVTGSKHLLMLDDGRKLLLDCGTFQGRREEADRKNRNFPKEVVSADALILSHAHIDHSGAIPSLVKAGFRNKIFATPATRDLAEIMLADSARIAESDAEYVNRKHWPPIEPIYTEGDAREALKLFESKTYGAWFDVLPGVRARFHDAGHILGSAQVELEIEEKGKVKRVGFTGDLGRKHLPILRDPEQMQNLDYLITESTYGTRLHEDVMGIADKLLAVVERTLARGGKIIIPAFSVERTQEIVYVLHELYLSGKLKHEIPIFVDSPLAINATEIFKKHRDCYDAETYATFIEKGEGPFTMQSLEYVREAEKSKSLNNYEIPIIIIAASGMCEAGRILHHLKNNLSDPANTILIVGFQAANTLGRKLVEKLPIINIFGEPHKLRAEVAVLNAFSGHADADELLVNVKNSGTLKKVFCVHGENETVHEFAKQIQKDFGFEAIVPKEGMKYEV